LESIRILHTADIHLRDTNADGQAKAFARIIALAKEEHPDALLIAGDLFDSGFESKSEKNYMVSLLAEIGDIPVFIAAGNHDSLPCYKDISLPENVHLFGAEMEKYSVGCADIYGISMTGTYSEKSLIDGFSVEDRNRVNILVIHGDIDTASPYNPISSGQLAEAGIDYAALGHVHKSGGVCRKGSACYAYPGVPQGRGFDETGEKGVLIGSVGKGYADLKLQPTCEYIYEEKDVDITGCTDYSGIAEKIRENIDPNNCTKVYLTGSFAGGFALNTQRAANLLEDCRLVKIYDETGEQPDLNKLKNEQSLKGFFVRCLADDPEGEEAIRLGLAALDGKEINVL
jgi:exonuclease SbcD